MKINRFSYNFVTKISIIILLFLLFYKLHFQFSIAASGDELNSILVYSSNIKTLFLKNFPGNVTFFHFFGYLKSKVIGYDLITYRSLTFIFFLLHFWILERMKIQNSFKIGFFLLIITSYLSYYIGQYSGYLFSSFLYVLIYYLIKCNKKNDYNKIILILLFIQIYNHLVNLYLVLPILISIFIYSKKKINFFKEFLIYFFLPVLFFYLISSILTGLSELKISNTGLSYVATFLFNDFLNIIKIGFTRIFFYEAYSSANKFEIIQFIINFIIFDKIIFVIFILSFICAIINLKYKNISTIFSVIIISHIFMLFLINKDPALRIFSGFYCFYIFFIFDFLRNNNYFIKVEKNKFIFIFLLILLVISVFKFNYKKIIETNINFPDFTFFEEIVSTKYLQKNCYLKNYNFTEIQKRNYYFNYINICKKKFDLSEFINYYRSN